MSTINPDKRSLFIGGDAEGNIFASGGQFGELHKICGPERPAIIEIIGGISHASDDQESAKITRLTGEVYIKVIGDIFCADEEGVDITGCRDQTRLSWTGDLIITEQSKHGIIVKGDSDGVTLSGRVRGHGRDCDLELGGPYVGKNLPDWNEGTTGTVLDLQSADPLNLRVFSATEPRIANSQAYKREKWLELVYPIWLWFRKRGIGK